MRTAAVLPVKRFAEAKQRLSGSAPDALRAALAEAMVADVLAALAACDALEATIVVSAEPALVDSAREHGALLVPDEAESGQSAAAELGIAQALAAGVERVLCVPGDCPALDPQELGVLLASTDAPLDGVAEVVIVPDRHGMGTNGLLLTPPGAIAPSFGPDSCERHRGLALAAGARVRIERPPSLLLDVDTGADLEALQARLAGHGAGAPRTRAALAGAEPDSALAAARS
jgi:2-phospho-L-lactate guanylyltransferase